MRKSITIALILFLQLKISAQGFGKEWVLSFNASALDFSNDTVILDTILGNMPMFLTDADICDTDGSLLYFTNGCYIADKNGNLLQNGDTLSPCYYTDEEYPYGLDIQQATVFLPKPGSTRYYYLFHFSGDTLNRPNTIYYSLIDKEGNSGLGAVIEKNVPIIKLNGRNILRGGGMTACKHANGRDYWIVMGGSNNNEFYKFLLTPDTILGPFIQYIGPVFHTPQDNTYSKFSQDGSKYVSGCFEGLVLVMDFDRCSGEFSNPITIFNNSATNPDTLISGSTSQEFSPNGRFVYVSSVIKLNQYDLWADTIQDSIQIYLSDSSDFYGLDMLQLAPNGKLYCSTWNGGLHAMHVINYPDSLGLACNFVYGGQPTLTANSDVVPNMINYNLGALIGSGCDTITTGLNHITENDLLRVMPNPANKYLYVEMGMQGNYEFDLLNTMGQVVDKKETRQVDIFDMEYLSSGVYFLRSTDKAKNKAITQKVIVQH